MDTFFKQIMCYYHLTGCFNNANAITSLAIPKPVFESVFSLICLIDILQNHAPVVTDAWPEIFLGADRIDIQDNDI